MIFIYFCLFPLILSQFYHNAAIITSLLPDKAREDVEEVMEESPFIAVEVIKKGYCPWII